MASTLRCFAVCAPGLEPVLAAELEALGIRPGRRTRGGIAFVGTTRQLYAANVWLRTAARVLVRVGRFRATRFDQLQRHLEGLRWEGFVAPGTPLRVRASATASRLYHTGAIEERTLAVLGAGEVGGGDGPTQAVLVRVVADTVTVSVDASGVGLHRRGWRHEGAKAPVRETLAAAMVLASGWAGDLPLADPLCGSGTVVIEAARVAAGLPPSPGREYAFARWPAFEPGTWASVQGDVRQAEVRATDRVRVPLVAADRDPGAVAAARANAERAGVAHVVEVRRAPLSATVAELAPGPGLLLSNPPYGTRIAPGRDLRDLYGAIGSSLRGPLSGWSAGLLVADRVLAGHTGLGFEERFATVNGGIGVRFLIAPPTDGMPH